MTSYICAMGHNCPEGPHGICCGEPLDQSARIAELETLLARNLVFDHGSAEEAADALGGLGRVFDLVTAYREANPLPEHESDVGNPISESATGIDGNIAF
jgi:hypothetical protein